MTAYHDEHENLSLMNDAVSAPRKRDPGMTNPSELVGDVDVCPHCRGTGQPHGIMGGPEHGLCSWCKGTGQKFSSPRNPSDTRDSELVAKLPSRDDIAKLLFDLRQSGHDWETAIDGDPESDAGELASICREDADEVLVLISQSLAADTIDRLTSSGEAGGVTAIVDGLREDYETVRKWSGSALVAGELSKSETREGLTQLYSDLCGLLNSLGYYADQLESASPREGHVEVPVEVLEHCLEAFQSLPEDALGYGDGGPGSDVRWPFRDELIDRVRAALPHNQGETKP